MTLEITADSLKDRDELLRDIQHLRAMHHKYEQALQAKVAELEAQVAALSAPVTAGEWRDACQGRLYGRAKFVDITSALIAARVSKLKENS